MFYADASLKPEKHRPRRSFVGKQAKTKTGSERHSAGESAPAAPICVLRKAGEFWTVGHGGALSYVKDSKGLAYIERLVSHRGVEFHVLDLARIGSPEASTETAPSIGGLLQEGMRTGAADALGDAGELLDDRSKAEYRRRLAELREMLDDARERSDVERAGAIEDEIDALSRELSRAIGKGGRHRRAASAPERARVAVTKAIKYAIDKIAQNDAIVASILERSIRTGTFCVYDDGAAPVMWQLGAAAAPLSASDKLAPIQLPPAIASGRRTEFVGRDAERGQVLAAFHNAIGGEGSVIVIGGGPGVGKTRLAIESARQAAASRAAVLLGRCYETQEPHPYIPFVEIIETALAHAATHDSFRAALGENAPELAQLVPRLRRLFPDIPPPLELPPPQAQRYLFESVYQFLARSARARPVFLILDDLHWADEATLALFSHLARRLHDVPAVIVGTYRDLPAEMNAPLVKTLEDLIREGMRAVRLQGLPADAVNQMIRALCGSEPPAELGLAVYSETGGNPFFVEELVKHLIEEDRLFDRTGRFRADLRPGEFAVPQSVSLVVGRRLDRLAQGVREVLSGAAVLGSSFESQPLEAVAESDTAAVLGAIDEALKAGLIVTRSNRDAPLAFVHEIVRQTILDRVSPPRLQRMHLRAARLLQARYAESLDEHAADIAGHLMAAAALAQRSELIEYFTRAGRHAAAAAAHRNALHFFEAALKLVASGSAQRAELLSDLGMAKRSLDLWQEALAHWREALDYYAAAGDLSAVGRLSFTIVEALSWAGRYIDAATVAYGALAQLRGAVSADRARLLGAVGMINSGAGAYQAAHDALAQAAQLAEQLGDYRALGAVASYQAHHNFMFLRVNDAISDGQRSADLLRAEGALWSLAQMLGFLQSATMQAGRIEQARAIGRELEPLAVRLGHSAARMLCGRVSAWCDFCAHPSLDVLERAFEQDLEITQSAGLPWIATSYAQLGLVNFLRGEWQRGLEFCEQANAAEFPNAFDGFGAGVLARQRAYLGDRAGVLQVLEAKKTRMPQAGSPHPIGSWALLMLLIEALYVCGERERAGELYPLALQAADTGLVCMTVISRFTDTIAGVAAAAARKWQDAERHFQAAIARAGTMPHPLERCEAHRLYGQMLMERAAGKDRERARIILGEAAHGYRAIGMPRHFELTAALLKQAGG